MTDPDGPQRSTTWRGFFMTCSQRTRCAAMTLHHSSLAVHAAVISGALVLLAAEASVLAKITEILASR